MAHRHRSPRESAPDNAGSALPERYSTKGIHIRQDEIAAVAIEGTDRTIGVGIFPDDLRGHMGSHAVGSPAALGIIDPPKAGLVLKEDL